MTRGIELAEWEIGCVCRGWGGGLSLQLADLRATVRERDAAFWGLGGALRRQGGARRNGSHSGDKSSVKRRRRREKMETTRTTCNKNKHKEGRLDLSVLNV